MAVTTPSSATLGHDCDGGSVVGVCVRVCRVLVCVRGSVLHVRLCSIFTARNYGVLAFAGLGQSVHEISAQQSAHRTDPRPHPDTAHTYMDHGHTAPPHQSPSAPPHHPRPQTAHEQPCSSQRHHTVFRFHLQWAATRAALFEQADRAVDGVVAPASRGAGAHPRCRVGCPCAMQAYWK